MKNIFQLALPLSRKGSSKSRRSGSSNDLPPIDTTTTSNSNSSSSPLSSQCSTPDSSPALTSTPTLESIPFFLPEIEVPSQQQQQQQQQQQPQQQNIYKPQAIAVTVGPTQLRSAIQMAKQARKQQEVEALSIAAGAGSRSRRKSSTSSPSSSPEMDRKVRSRRPSTYLSVVEEDE